ncbi:MAG: aspartate 1-decarboxylase [Desulfovibrio sp.]|nr:aspartate 1-decarboxylase [Desulfovibrio sp.]
MLQVLRAKLHGIRVTGCDLNYHGSVTLDPVICARAGIYPLEFVYLWNKNTASRISTYVIYGEAGSGACIVNGAAARTCAKGDPLIICAYAYVQGPQEICAHAPLVLTFAEDNSVQEAMVYTVRQEADWYAFRCEPTAKG